MSVSRIDKKNKETLAFNGILDQTDLTYSIKSVPWDADIVNSLAHTQHRTAERQLGTLEVKNRCGLERGK